MGNLMEDAISEYIFDVPFIGYCLVKFRITPDDRISTMGVSIHYGVVDLKYNEEWVKTLSKNELMGVLEHEFLHVLHLHCVREEERNHLRWNVACDLAINPLVSRKLPKGALNPPSEWKGQCAEWIFDKLKDSCIKKEGGNGSGKGKENEKENEKGKGKGNGNGNEKKNENGNEKKNENGNGNKNEGGGGTKKEEIGEVGEKEEKREGGGSYKDDEVEGNVIDDHSGWGDSDQKEVVESVVREMVEDAVMKAKGDVPGNYRDLVSEILKPKVNWKELLRYYLSSRLRLDLERTWKVRNRRLLSISDFVFPGLAKRRGIEVVVAIDTSGSIGGKEAEQFFGEVESIVTRLNASVTLIECDAAIHHCAPYKKGDWKKIGFKGRGGTDFRPVFEKIEKDKMNPKVLVYLTDGYGDYPSNEPPYDTIWIITEMGGGSALTDKNWKPPFGKVIPLEIK